MAPHSINLTLKPEAKNALTSTFFVANAFVWYLGAFSFLQSNFTEDAMLRLLIISVNIIFLIFTALSATLLINKFKRRLNFQKYWILVGVLFSLIYFMLDLSNLSTCVVASSILGVYFGLGMPITMGYFSATTSPEKRGQYSALIILAIGLGFPILSIIGSAQILLIPSTLAIWRLLPLIALKISKPPEIIAEPKNTVSYRAVIGNKTFLLYLIPWLMFALINDLTWQITSDAFDKIPSLTDNYLLIENILSGISAVACGFLADRKGRKRIALIGFAILGVGYAALGVTNVNEYAAWFYIVADGIAWGAFSMLFIITLWGDIAQEKNSEKYYFLGVLPYLLSNFTGISTGSSISAGILVGTVFSFASFFLFIAILPLAYAPETLSDKTIKNLDLNSYVNKALEKAKKDGAKSQKKKPPKQQEKQQTDEPEVEDQSDEYEAAKSLAEKYY